MPFYCELRNPYFLHHRVPSSNPLLSSPPFPFLFLSFLSFLFFSRRSHFNCGTAGRNGGRGAPRVIGYAPEKPKNRAGGWLAIVRTTRSFTCVLQLKHSSSRFLHLLIACTRCILITGADGRRSTKLFLPALENHRRIFLLPVTCPRFTCPVLSCHSYTFESVFALLTRSLRGWSLKDSLEEVAREKTCFSVRDASVRGHLQLLLTSLPSPPFFFSFLLEDSLLKKCFNIPPSFSFSLFVFLSSLPVFLGSFSLHYTRTTTPRRPNSSLVTENA